MAAFLLPFLCFVLVAALLPPACRMAVRRGFVDLPGGRKRHENPVPAIGGLVVFPVFLCALWFVPVHMPGEAWFVLGLLLLLVTGALDDWADLPARMKFLLQILAAVLIAVPGGAHIVSLGDIFGTGNFYLSFMSIPFSVIATVLLINAINLMDGVDGLAGGAAVIIFGWLAAVALLAGQAAYAAPLLSLAAAFAGFLVYNLRRPGRARASVFLGDAGSLAAGLAIAWFSLRLADKHVLALQPMAVAWLLALPIMDTCGQFARRVREGRHPFDPDHHHFHHLLLDAGLSPGRAAFAVHLIVFLTGLIGIGGSRLGVPVPVLAAAWVLLLLLHIWLCLKPERMLRMIGFLCARRAVP
jgi:UDP-GlcNAc:undecaprenyl-phosphate GlcNAc-1-phosphate transferase